MKEGGTGRKEPNNLKSSRQERDRKGGKGQAIAKEGWGEKKGGGKVGKKVVECPPGTMKGNVSHCEGGTRGITGAERKKRRGNRYPRTTANSI